MEKLRPFLGIGEIVTNLPVIRHVLRRLKPGSKKHKETWDNLTRLETERDRPSQIVRDATVEKLYCNSMEPKDLVSNLNKLIANKSIRDDVTRLLNTKVGDLSQDTINSDILIDNNGRMGFLGLLNGVIGSKDIIYAQFDSGTGLVEWFGLMSQRNNDTELEAKASKSLHELGGLVPKDHENDVLAEAKRDAETGRFILVVTLLNYIGDETWIPKSVNGISVVVERINDHGSGVFKKDE